MHRGTVAVPSALLAGVLVAAACAPTAPPPPAAPALTGPYLGQEPPGLEPRLFAPGVVSTGLEERDLAVTPDGNELFFTVTYSDGVVFAAIVTTRLEDGRWTPPEVAPFSGTWSDFEPCLSPDGQRLLFASTRPRPGDEPKARKADLWVVDRAGKGWGEPRPLGPPVNSEEEEYFPSLSRNGTLYFTVQNEAGEALVKRSRMVDGAWAEPELLPPEVNCGRMRFNTCVAPDESYVIVCAVGGEGNLGGADYFAVFRTPDDRWSPPVNLGPAVNAAKGREWSPSISPDGRYLFFMSSRPTLQDGHSPVPLHYQDLQRMGGEPGNGDPDVWWVSAEVVEALRPDGW
jgi:Tol biopolymer transport system component